VIGIFGLLISLLSLWVQVDWKPETLTWPTSKHLAFDN